MSLIEKSILLNFSSNWTANNGNTLEDTVDVFSGPISHELVNSVLPNTCVCLEYPNVAGHDEERMKSPKLDIQVPSAHVISSVKILSEARMIEAYGPKEEYLSTSHSTFIDDWEGLAVNETIIEINAASCSLKFLKLKDHHRLWIYKIEIVVKGTAIQKTHFNLDNINKLMENSQHPLSDKAEKCKKFLQFYAAQGDNNSTLEPPLLAMFSKKLNLGTQFPVTNKQSREVMQETRIEERQDLEPGLKSEIVTFVNQKCDDLKIDIITYIDKKFLELKESQNKKLDQILQLLREKDSV